MKRADCTCIDSQRCGQ